jgi:hypothetical protein
VVRIHVAARRGDVPSNISGVGLVLAMRIVLRTIGFRRLDAESRRT